MFSLTPQDVELIGLILQAVVAIAVGFLFPLAAIWLKAKKAEAVASMDEKTLSQLKALTSAWTIQAEKYALQGKIEASAEAKYNFVKNQAIEAFPSVPVAQLAAIIEQAVHDNFNWDEFLSLPDAPVTEEPKAE